MPETEEQIKLLHKKIDALGIQHHSSVWNETKQVWEDHVVPPTPPVPAPPTPPVPDIEPDEGFVCPVNIANGVKWESFKAHIAVDASIRDDHKDLINEEVLNVINWTNSVCDLELSQNDKIQRFANIYVTVKGIDGRGNVLGRALQWILRGFLKRVVVEIDLSDMGNRRFNAITIRHELLHAVGVSHPSDTRLKTLMSAIISNVYEFGEYEENFLKKLYKKSIT